MWHEEAEEPEDNVLALTLSFLTAARYTCALVTGTIDVTL